MTNILRHFFIKATMALLTAMLCIGCEGTDSGIDDSINGGSGGITTYTVTFDSDGGTEIADEKVNSGEMIDKPTSPTKTGYTFAGWYSNPALTQSYSFSTKVTANITLYAKWNTNSYTVTFESNKGTNVDSQYIKYNSAATQPTDPTKAGYTFAGWYSNSIMTQPYSFFTKVTKNITLYAKWSTNSYTVTFESNKGSNVDSQYIKYNSVATQPTPPTKTGFNFAGWYTNSALTQPYSFSTKVTANITLYAKWSTNSYTVTFESNKGSSVNSQYIEYNSTVTQPTPPTKTGFTFAGWYSNSTLTQPYSFSSKVTKNITLYAKWGSTNSYTVTFNSNGGSPVNSQLVEHGLMVTQPVDPTHSESIFGGWYTDSNCTEPFDFATKINNNITLYARWATTTHKVSFDTDGGSYLAPVYIASGSPISCPTPPQIAWIYVWRLV